MTFFIASAVSLPVHCRFPSAYDSKSRMAASISASRPGALIGTDIAISLRPLVDVNIFGKDSSGLLAQVHFGDLFAALFIRCRDICVASVLPDQQQRLVEQVRPVVRCCKDGHVFKFFHSVEFGEHLGARLSVTATSSVSPTFRDKNIDLLKEDDGR